MKPKTKKTIQLYASIIGLASVLAFAALQFGDPLLPASDLQVTYEVDGKVRHDATVYQSVLGDEHVYYVQLPGAGQQWWVVDMSSKSLYVREDGESYWIPRALAAPGADVASGEAAAGKLEWGMSERIAWFNGEGFSCTVRAGGA